MNWLDSLERRYGHLAIHGLIRIVVGFTAAVFIMYKMNPEYLGVLTLDPARVMHGEVWRLFTYIFIPQFGGLLPDWLGVVLYMWFLWMLGEGLEQEWGAFRLNLFYGLGMLGTTIAAFFFGSAFSNAMLNQTLLFAFATLFPDFTILFMFIFPLKIKWVAWFSFAGTMLLFLTGPISLRMAVIAALANYAIFFGPMIFRLARHNRGVAARRRTFQENAAPEDVALHCCAICKKTEQIAPDLDFRVAADGEEYCTAHLPKTPVEVG